MGVPSLTLIEVRTAHLELRKRVVPTVDALESAVLGSAHCDAVLAARAGEPLPNDAALLDALAAFDATQDPAVFSCLGDTLVITDVAMGTPDWAMQLAPAMASTPSVLLVSVDRPKIDDLKRMARQWSVALEAKTHPAVMGEPSAAPRIDRGGLSAEATHNRRSALLAQEPWFTSQDAASQARGRTVESNPYEYASRLRREHRLFGARFRGRYLYPAFQFVSDTGEPHPALRDLIAVLPESNDGWTAAFWLFEPTGRLQGARPVDRFGEDPTAVITAAKHAFQGDDRDW